MNNPLFHRIIAYLNILLVLLLILDSYIGQRPILERFDHDAVERGSSTYHYFIISLSGTRVQIPSNTDMAMEAGDTFYIATSVLFHRQMSVTYSGPDKKPEIYYIGIIRGTWFGKLAILLILAISIVNVGRSRRIRDDMLNQRLLLGGLLLALIVAACYFFL